MNKYIWIGYIILSTFFSKNECASVNYEHQQKESYHNTIEKLLSQEDLDLKQIDEAINDNIKSRNDVFHFLGQHAKKINKNNRKQILEYFSEKHDINSFNIIGHLPIVNAARSLDIDAVNLFLSIENIDVNLKDAFENIALSCAIENLAYEKNDHKILIVVNALLDAGANPNVFCDKKCPVLCFVAKNNSLELIKLLLLYGADPKIPGSSGKNFLDYANANPEIAKIYADHIFNF